MFQLSQFYDPNRGGFTLETLEEIHPGGQVPADPVSPVGTYLPAGDVKEREALGLVPGKGSEGGEGVRGCLKALGVE